MYAHAIYVGQWRFYPELMGAQNMHNGAWAQFARTSDGGWCGTVVNCPAPWMLNEITDWFLKWIDGRQ